MTPHYPDTVTVQLATGTGNYGDPTWGAKATMPARVESDVRRVRRGSDGEEVASDTRLLTPEEVTILHRVWLPGADVDKPEESRTVLSAGKNQTIDGSSVEWDARL